MDVASHHFHVGNHFCSHFRALSGAYQVLASLVDLSTPKDFSDQDGSRRDGSDRVIMSQRTVFLPSPMIREV